MTNILVQYLFNESRTEINLEHVVKLAGNNLDYKTEEEKVHQATHYAVNMVRDTDLSNELTLMRNFIHYFSLNDFLIHDFPEGLIPVLDINDEFIKGLSSEIVMNAQNAVEDEELTPSSSITVRLIIKGFIPREKVPVIFENAIKMIAEFVESDNSVEFDHEYIRLAMTQLNSFFDDDYIIKNARLFILTMLPIYNIKTTFTLPYLRKNVDLFEGGIVGDIGLTEEALIELNEPELFNRLTFEEQFIIRESLYHIYKLKEIQAHGRAAYYMSSVNELSPQETNEEA